MEGRKNSGRGDGSSKALIIKGCEPRQEDCSGLPFKNVKEGMARSVLGFLQVLIEQVGIRLRLCMGFGYLQNIPLYL